MEISIFSIILILIVFATIIIHVFHSKITSNSQNRFTEGLILVIFGTFITITMIIITIISLLTDINLK